MKTASAPSQLPFAPRPLPNELFSSWVLRIAHANCVSPEELMLGFQCRHSDLPSLSSLDWGLPLAFLNAMATFSRTSVSSLGRLDLRKRLPQSERALLLRFGVSDRSQRLRRLRTGYGFCPPCISLQAYVHVRWEWAFPALLRCHIHKSPLRHGCPTCGEDDPLPFGSSPAVAPVLCWSCGAKLTLTTSSSRQRQIGGAQLFVEQIYRAALRAANPDAALLGAATGTQLRCFVEDLLQLLAWYPSHELSTQSTDPRNLHFAFRTEILTIIGSLIMDALPSSVPRGKQNRLRNGCVLWLRVLALLSHREEGLIETSSQRWPAALRRRLTSALDQHERSRSRSSPFRGRFFRPGLEYIKRLEFRDLSAENEIEIRNSGI